MDSILARVINLPSETGGQSKLVLPTMVPSDYTMTRKDRKNVKENYLLYLVLL